VGPDEIIVRNSEELAILLARHGIESRGWYPDNWEAINLRLTKYLNDMQELRETVARHDEIIKAIPDLVKAVQELRMEIVKMNTIRTIIFALFGIVGSCASCIGTWFVMIHFGK